ncbi:MAG TPA: exosortase H [Thermoanaerobaculia bacterium]|jgi:exosortase H (IPTLxxWG-CTERM-specific)
MSEAPVSARRRSVGFLLRFVALLLVFYLIVASHPVNDAVIVPFTAAIASVSGRILNSLGERAEVVGTEIRSSSFGVNIENGCNGVETALLFGAAVLAFPASWKRRLLGLLAGFVAIQVLNLLRVITLFWIGLHRPALFNSSHTVIWQSVVVLFGVLLFLLWASRQNPLSAERSPAGRERSRKG